MLKRRDNCRLCGSRDVIKIYPMPACAPVDNYRFEDEADVNLPAFPMDLYQCRACGHAQLLDVVDPKILFGNYIYTSSSSPDLDAHFTAYANRVIDYVKLGDGSFVIDVGGNDGLFLSKFMGRGINLQIVDPAEKATEIAKGRGIPTIVSFLNEETCTQIRDQKGLADVVSANNVYSHSDDLIGFTRCVKGMLKPDGVFVFEVSYLRDLVEKKVIDYVYHEHLAHHSVKPFKTFFESLDMILFDVERVAVKGGSIRCYAALKGSQWTERPAIQAAIDAEESLGLYGDKAYSDLKREMDALGDKTRQVLQSTIEKGGTVASYGASATATVLNAMFDINKYFSFIVDDNAARQGRLSPGVKIPVVSNSEFHAKMPTVTFISSWRFADMIIARNQAYLDNGGKFITPLPEFRIIEKASK
jgi:SAM-dependent methyltransferase